MAFVYKCRNCAAPLGPVDGRHNTAIPGAASNLPPERSVFTERVAPVVPAAAAPAAMPSLQAAPGPVAATGASLLQQMKDRLVHLDATVPGLVEERRQLTRMLRVAEKRRPSNVVAIETVAAARKRIAQ
jgi:hypothetical protein